MANEITFTFQILLNNAGLRDTHSSNSIAATQNNPGLVRNVQSIPTAGAGTALLLGSVSTPGWAVFQNLDTTNYIEIGTVGFVAFARLEPGEQCLIRLGSTPYARANTAAVELFYVIYED